MIVTSAGVLSKNEAVFASSSTLGASAEFRGITVSAVVCSGVQWFGVVFSDLAWFGLHTIYLTASAVVWCGVACTQYTLL